MAEDGSGGQTPVGWVIANGAAVVAILALVIYGVARRGIDGFYGHLDLTAEDVGLTQAVIIARAAQLGVVIAAEVAGLAALGIFLVASLLRVVRSKQAKRGKPIRRSYESRDDFRWRFAWGLYLIVVIGLPLLIVSFRSYRQAILLETSNVGWSTHRYTLHHYEILGVLYWLLIAGIATWFLHIEHRQTIDVMYKQWTDKHPYLQLDDRRVPYLLYRERDKYKNHPDVTHRSSPPLEAKLALAGVFALGAAGLLVLTTNVGWRRAELVIAGTGENPNWGGLAVRADPMCLSWPDTTKLELQPDAPYIYLGGSGDTIVVYDYRVRRIPIRVPASGVQLTHAVRANVDAPWYCPGAQIGTPHGQ